MKLILSSAALIIFLFISAANAATVMGEYNVKTNGIKIGNFNWYFHYKENRYETKVSLKSSGLVGAIYKFEGEYISTGLINNNILESQNYKQNWKTREKNKLVEMLFDKDIVKLNQKPVETEHPRIDIQELRGYNDPISSFLSIILGSNEAKTIDGRRIYTLEKNEDKNKNKIILKIKNYQNIWADHKRNDLKKIEFFIEDKDTLPKKINIYFKNSLFKLNKI